MRPASGYRHRHSWKMLLLLPLLCLLSSSIRTVVSKSNGSTGELQWQILTKDNFSSEIRLHPHILVMVTVPWSGESRSLMRELALAVTKKREKFITLKLMLIHRNRDKMLADALGANEGINIIYYWHALPYKYQGALRVQNILSSGLFLMSLSPEEIPFKSLATEGELKKFMNSTDKAVLLLEFCGWAPKLMAKVNTNGSEGGLLSTFLNGLMNETLATMWKRNHKRMENEINNGVDNWFAGTSGLGEFTFINESQFLESEMFNPSDGVECSFEDFQQFGSFLANLTSVAREFILPPEKLKFGLLYEKSLLPSLGIGNTTSWAMMVYFAGCPRCMKVIRSGIDLKRVLESHASPVTELTSNGQDFEPGLPATQASVLLFIDRSSDSPKVRRNSKAALDVFRELAVNNQIPNQMPAQQSAEPKKFSWKAQSARTISGHPKPDLPQLSKRLTALKDRMSMMILNEGEYVTLDEVDSDLEGSSFQEILAHVLQQREEIKLSLLAKDVGFKLISDDLGIKVSDTMLTETKSQASQFPAEPSIESHLEDNAECQKGEALCDLEREKVSKVKDAKYSIQQDEETYVDTSNQPLMNPSSYNTDQVVTSSTDGEVEAESLSEVGIGLQQQYLTGFNGSFFFSDGHFRLLKDLTAGSRIPSLVIVDPLSHQHYVFPEDAVFSYSLLSGFLAMFLNGTLLPYKRSESVILDPRESPRPPFVNLDFHEVDSIPRVTTQTFMQLVVGNQSDSIHADDAWKKDVMVLFSISGCGFCQRMELYVREVYRTFKGYGSTLKKQSSIQKSSLRSDDINDTKLKLPLIYLIDCTWNDCSSILKTMTEELYPSLLLFPAERKNALSYKGDISVTDIMKFIADHGSNSRWLYKEIGARDESDGHLP